MHLHVQFPLDEEEARFQAAWSEYMTTSWDRTGVMCGMFLCAFGVVTLAVSDGTYWLLAVVSMAAVLALPLFQT